MLTSKEVFHIFLAVVLFAFIISFLQGLNAFVFALLASLIIILTNLVGKHLCASYLDAKLEHKIWHIQRWGWYERSYSKNPIPMGILLPFLLIILSWGYIKAPLFLQTEAKTTSARAAKRRGSPERFSELTEWNHASIPALGIVANLVLALILFIITKTFSAPSILSQIAKFSVYYAMWNLIPLGKLDGAKILFGSRFLWILLVIFSAIFTILALFLL